MAKRSDDKVDQGAAQAAPAEGVTREAEAGRGRGRRRVLLATAAAACALPGAYALAGYYLVPHLIRTQATDWAQSRLGKRLTLGDVRFDPFRFTLDIDDFAIDAPPKQPMLAFGRLHLAFAVRSLFEHAWRFEEVRLERPFVDAVLRRDGSLNLAELMPKSAPGEASGPSPAVRIDRLTIGRAQLRYRDERTRETPQLTLRPVGLTLRDFETAGSGNGLFALKATSARNERLDWTGTLSLASLTSRGRLTLTGLQAQTVQDFFGAALPVRLTAGRASLSGRYDFEWRNGGLRLTADAPSVVVDGLAAAGRPGSGLEGRATVDHATARIGRLQVTTGGAAGVRVALALPDMTLTGGTLADPLGLRGARVRFARLALEDGRLDTQAQSLSLARAGLDGLALTDPRALHDAALRVASSRLEGGRVDYGARTVALGRLEMTGADLPLRREADGSINWLKLVPGSGRAGGAAGGAKGEAAGGWAVGLEQASLGQSVLRFEDRAVAPVARFVLRPLSLTARGLSSDLSRPVAVRFGATLDGRTPVRGEGQVTPASGVVDLDLAFTHLPLKALDSYIPKTPGLVVRSGLIGASGRLHLAGGDLSAVRFRGNALVDDFIADDTISRSPIVAWRAFALTGIDYGAKGVTIERGRLSAPLGRVEIMADGTFNYTALTGGAAATPGAAPASPVVPPAAPVAEAKPADAGGVPAPVAPASTPTPASPSTPAPVPAPTPAPAPAHAAQPALPVRLRHLEVEGGRMIFADQSIDPHFEAEILGLRGRLDQLSNAPGTITAIDLTGHVIDRFSPVTIQGQMDLMGYDRRTDMHVAFRNIELPVFNPYSGRYAGYAIAKGKLTARFDYRIEDRALKADHHVIIDQIKWGEATESKQKVPMPIRLATALLKDKNGVIDLDVPVTGSLDDPQFRLAPIVWKIVGNVIEKAITAPFRLLGSLFAGAEKARYIDFAPGSALLPEGATEAFSGLAKALEAREELELDIPAGPGIREDANALADRRIDALLMAKEARKGQPADFAALKPDAQSDRLKQLYRTKLGGKPDFASLAADPAAGPEKGPDGKKLSDGDRRRLREIGWMREKLRAAFQPSMAELEKLGRDRAIAVRDALLGDGRIDPGRIFLVTGEVVAAQDGDARMELKLK